MNEFVNLMDDSKPVQEVLAEMIDGGVDWSIGCTGNIKCYGICLRMCPRCMFSLNTLRFRIKGILFQCLPTFLIILAPTFSKPSQGWGVVVLVGVPHMDAVFKMHPINVLNEGGAQGNLHWQLQLRSDLPALVEMYMNKELELEKFITHEVPFSEISKAFDYMLQGGTAFGASFAWMV